MEVAGRLTSKSKDRPRNNTGFHIHWRDCTCYIDIQQPCLQIHAGKDRFACGKETFDALKVYLRKLVVTKCGRILNGLRRARIDLILTKVQILAGAKAEIEEQLGAMPLMRSKVTAGLSQRAMTF